MQTQRLILASACCWGGGGGSVALDSAGRRGLRKERKRVPLGRMVASPGTRIFNSHQSKAPALLPNGVMVIILTGRSL